MIMKHTTIIYLCVYIYICSRGSSPQLQSRILVRYDRLAHLLLSLLGYHILPRHLCFPSQPHRGQGQTNDVFIDGSQRQRKGKTQPIGSSCTESTGKHPAYCVLVLPCCGSNFCIFAHQAVLGQLLYSYSCVVVLHFPIHLEWSKLLL